MKRKKFVKVELMARQWILYCQMIRFKHKVSSSKHKRARAMLYLSACIVFCVMIWWITSYIWNLLLKRHSCTTDLNAKIHIIMSLMLSTKKTFTFKRVPYQFGLHLVSKLKVSITMDVFAIDTIKKVFINHVVFHQSYIANW